MITYNPSLGDVDIIFAGGGTAACVAAGRLAKADPNLKILLIEGGKNNFDDPTVTNPALFLAHLAPDSKTALFYKSEPSEHLDGRQAVVPMGGMLGGGSSINLVMYTRAQGADYDSWNTPGWMATDMIPLCNKIETFHQDEEGIDRKKHGYDGPVQISDGGFRGKSERQFLDTITKLGFKEIVDLNDFEQIGGFTRLQRYVSRDGKRQDAAHCYIHPLLQDGQHPNLHLLLESKVTRVIFDDSSPPRAVGVEYKPFQNNLLSVVRANRLVVVAAGSLGTPQILERSGVGNADILRRLKIPVISDLPGVGENYQDHQILLTSYKTSLAQEDTLDGIVSGRKDIGKALAEKDPQLGWNSMDIAAKLRMTDADAKTLGLDFQRDWERDFVPQPNRPVIIMNVINTFVGDPSLVEAGQYTTIGTITLYPYSRGSIHITSPEDVVNGYKFDTGFLSQPSDIKVQLWAYKMSREVARRLPYYRGELALGHPKFREGSNAAVLDAMQRKQENHLGEDFANLKDIEYSEHDDVAIEAWIRGNINTTWHSLGTCAMKPKEKGGVVDKDLNVYGITGLKVADLSIVPENLGANVGNTAFAVGEKAALIIGKELGNEV